MLLGLFLLSVCVLEAYCQFTHDPFYRFSGKEWRFDYVYVHFPEEVALSQTYSREDPYATYTGTSIIPGINDGYNATPNGFYKAGGIIQPKIPGTYTGTSIPPGVNDGYFSTPTGEHDRSGGKYLRKLITQ